MFQRINQIETFWKCLTLFILMFLAWFTAAPAYAFDVTLQWDANREADLAGYLVYYKTETSGPPYNGTGADEGPSPINVGNTTEITLHDLDEDVVYFFAVTAYNTNQLESGYSNEVSALGASSNSGSDTPSSYRQPEDTRVSAEEDDYDDDGISDSEDPDDDNDGLSDIWEQAHGLDPWDSTGVNGSNGDLDGDGWSNHEEYENDTDPADRSSVPSILGIQIAETIPKNHSGVNDDHGVPNNTSFSVRIEAFNGIDTTDTASVVFTVKESSEAEYTRDLSDIGVMKVVSLTNEADTNMSHLWVSYYRPEEPGVFYPSRDYAYDARVTIKVDVIDRERFVLEQAFTFRVETEFKYTTAQESVEFLAISTIDPEDPDLERKYDAGIQINSGDLAGSRIIYSSDEPLVPTFGSSDELPPLDVEGMNGVGIPLVLEPHTFFITPVKVFIPCPESPDLSELFVLLHNGEEWVAACDENGEILPGGDGWMVSGSRIDHLSGDSSKIEIQVYHFSAVQAATEKTTDSVLEDEEDIIDERVEEGATGGSGGGGCFIGTATSSISNKGLHTDQGNENLNLSMISVLAAILVLVITWRLRAVGRVCIKAKFDHTRNGKRMMN